jgi:hypothetical protein
MPITNPTAVNPNKRVAVSDPDHQRFALPISLSTLDSGCVGFSSPSIAAPHLGPSSLSLTSRIEPQSIPPEFPPIRLPHLKLLPRPVAGPVPPSPVLILGGGGAGQIQSRKRWI